MDAFLWPWHSHLMHRRAAPRHFLIVFVLAQMLAAHGMLTAWGTGISAYAGNFGTPVLFCISGQGSTPSEPQSPFDQPVHHDCAMACAALAGPAPAPADGGILKVPPIGIGAVMATLSDEARPVLFSGVMRARGPPRTV